jgi:hypothetical protein
MPIPDPSHQQIQPLLRRIVAAFGAAKTTRQPGHSVLVLAWLVSRRALMGGLPTRRNIPMFRLVRRIRAAKKIGRPSPQDQTSSPDRDRLSI